MNAIATAKKESPLIKSAIEFQMVFYKGSAHLATVECGYGIFGIDRKPYKDTTGTLKALDERLVEQQITPSVH